MTTSYSSAPQALRRRTLEDKTVMLLTAHTGKIYLALLVSAILVVDFHGSTG